MFLVAERAALRGLFRSMAGFRHCERLDWYNNRDEP